MSAGPEADGARNILWVPYPDDPLAVTAARLLARFAQQLPDLSPAVVLLAEQQAAARLRQHLYVEAERRGHHALLGPTVETLRGWVEAQPLATEPVLSAPARELMLVEALQHHSALLGAASPWHLAGNLLELFDELSLQRIEPTDSLEDFTARLQRGYRIDGDAPAALGQEARLVHTLWRAYHAQAVAEHASDPQVAYLRRLDALRRSPDPARYVYLVGIDNLCASEAHWCRDLLACGRGELILHGQATMHDADAPMLTLVKALIPPPALSPSPSPACGRGWPEGSGEGMKYDNNGMTVTPSPQPSPSRERGATLTTAFLDTCFQHTTAPLAERARTFAAAHPVSPVQDHISVFAADGAEQEAMAIDVQVRRWLLDGKPRIGIVTENRLLARRVRALLERAGLLLQDSAGWALSTTRAAAILERWLETVEDDFAQQPLLDLLKSPYLFPEQPRASLQRVVHHFEMDIVRGANIARGLQRYRRDFEYRRHRLPHWTLEETHQLTELLEALAHAAAPLQRHLDGRRHAPADLLVALDESLRRLGLERTLATDPAGGRVLEELARMRAALPGRSLRMNWNEFRAWLGRTLEQHNFQPPHNHSPVQLLNLTQSRLQDFDALIIAGADRAHLPGECVPGPFFNQGVRRELGLPTWRDELTRRLHHFRRLLQAAPQVLITLCREQDGEDIAPCPWVDALQTFHRLAYGDALDNTTLAPLTQDARAQVFECDTTALPVPHPRPAPALRKGLLPHTLTVSAHQHLIDCPYAFFAGDCLQLRAPDEIRETLEKSDYGQRVHECLQIFHGGRKGFPGPFKDTPTAHNRDAARAMLHDISARVFARDLEDNFQHRGWLHRWTALIPSYIDWQIERNQHWQVLDTEADGKQALSPQLTLKGRLDRIDQGTDGIGIIDYKTGTRQTQDKVETGEDVQLTSYALLRENVTRVDYLQLDKDKVANKVSLEGEPLTQLAQAVSERLVNMTQSLRTSTPLPAWGASDICEHCTLDGVCRRQAWHSG